MEPFVRNESVVETLATSLGIQPCTAAAALLMDHAAPGWEANVNPAQLAMSSVNYCILGQQIGKHPFFEGCGGFSDAMERLGVVVGSLQEVDDAYRYNFSHSDSEWLTLLAARQAAKS